MAAGTALTPLFAADIELRIAVNRTTIESAPLLVQPIPGVRIVPVANGREASAQLVSGKVDAATGSETQLLLNSVAQPALRAILTLAECRYRMVARRSARIGNLAALREKRIAATAGTSSLYFLTRMLQAGGLKLSDVTLINMEGAEMPQALDTGRIDAMAMWEPHTQIAIDTLGPNAVLLEALGAYTERFNLNTTAAVLADPAKRKLLANVARHVRTVSPVLRRYVPELGRAIATPEPVITRAWPQFRFPAELDQRALLHLMEEIEPWAAATAQRSPRTRMQLENLIDDSIVRAAY